MSKKQEPKNGQSKKSSIKIVKEKKNKAPAVKLLTYTMKAVIPTGQYANLQPEITVQADSIEHAERVVMPYIETLFAKYREAGVRPIEARPVVNQAPVAPVQAPKPAPVAPVAPQKAPEAPKAPVSAPAAPVAPKAAPAAPQPAPAPAAIVMTVPFTRAKSALESCTSLAAFKLVSDQIEKSTKLVDAEKVELRKLAEAKLAQLNGKQS